MAGRRIVSLVVLLVAGVHRSPADDDQQPADDMQSAIMARLLGRLGAALVTEAKCERWPLALPVNVMRDYIQPSGSATACARSCLQLRNQGGAPQDGVYWFTGMPVPVMCDFSHDGGGWTLLFASKRRNNWDMLFILSSNPLSASLIGPYSILRHADAIRDLGTGSRFAYRIEAQAAERGRRHWGGVWSAPRHYSFVDETGNQTDVELITRFDSWEYSERGIEKRMPWLRGGTDVVLTTSAPDSEFGWGTLATSRLSDDYHWNNAPWMEKEAEHSGAMNYCIINQWTYNAVV
ncbi:hypothetical protein FJT64_000024 [Amphibalanus amphitrite]|uniref:Fibrinogen C-terminal domain-containing protein n=1 Tax=Amphibalanus amphitrite TaxID=1232801 RepID=A0A6A4XF98_AMPAM|nr:hypothetical protein FJT64_000024 [Amphibalanus amphitrite]